MSKIIYKINPSIEITGNSTTPRSGAFEISVNGKLIYSKFSTGEFPSEEELKIMVGE